MEKKQTGRVRMVRRHQEPEYELSWKRVVMPLGFALAALGIVMVIISFAATFTNSNGDEVGALGLTIGGVVLALVGVALVVFSVYTRSWKIKQ